MITDSATLTTPTPAQQAEAAQYATTIEAKTENTKQLAALADDALEVHIAEHVRGMVAATAAYVSLSDSATTQADAQLWQQWALGVADAVERGVPAVV